MNKYRLMRMFEYNSQTDIFEKEEVMMDFTASEDVGAVVAVLVGYLKSKSQFKVSGFDTDCGRNLFGINLATMDGKDEYHYLVKINGESK